MHSICSNHSKFLQIPQFTYPLKVFFIFLFFLGSFFILGKIIFPNLYFSNFETINVMYLPYLLSLVSKNNKSPILCFQRDLLNIPTVVSIELFLVSQISFLYIRVYQNFLCFLFYDVIASQKTDIH